MTDYKTLTEVARARYKLACDEMDRLTAGSPGTNWRWSIPANPVPGRRKHMSDYTPSIERVRDLYSWAYAWRTSDDIEEGEADLSKLRADQRAEFDRWLAEHDREVAARTLEDAADHYHADPSLGPEWRPVGWANRLRERAAVYRADQDGADRG